MDVEIVNEGRPAEAETRGDVLPQSKRSIQVHRYILNKIKHLLIERRGVFIYFGFLWILSITQGTQETLKTIEMVSMEVGDEDFIYFARFDITLLDLDLRSFSAIKQPNVTII